MTKLYNNFYHLHHIYREYILFEGLKQVNNNTTRIRRQNNCNYILKSYVDAIIPIGFKLEPLPVIEIDDNDFDSDDDNLLYSSPDANTSHHRISSTGELNLDHFIKVKQLTKIQKRAIYKYQTIFPINYLGEEYIEKKSLETI